MEENLSNSDISPFELLEFYTDIGVDEVVGDEAVDRTKIPENILPIIFKKFLVEKVKILLNKLLKYVKNLKLT